VALRIGMLLVRLVVDECIDRLVWTPSWKTLIAAKAYCDANA
jgi:hypothetical protein